MSELEDFDAYGQLADQLMGVATKEQVCEVARLLALNLAHYQLKYGELPLGDFEAMMKTEAPDQEMQEILSGRNRGGRNVVYFHQKQPP